MKDYVNFAEATGTDVRTRTVLLLDTSDSMKTTDWVPTRLAGAIDAVRDLIQVKAAKYPLDEVGIATFSDVASVLHRLTTVQTGGASLLNSMASIRVGPTTAMTSGLEVASRMLSENDQSIVHDRQVPRRCGSHYAFGELSRQIILITDGEHNQGPDPVPRAKEIQHAGVTINVIGIGTPSSLDHTSLRAIASCRSDGTASYCFVGDARDLSDKLRELAQHCIMPL